jgi:hypothetical protein
MPIIRSLSTAVAASGLPLERGSSSAVGRGRSGTINYPTQLQIVGHFRKLYHETRNLEYKIQHLLQYN